MLSPVTCRLSVVVLLLNFIICKVSAQTTIPLYDDSIPNSLVNNKAEYVTGEDPQVFNVTVPTLTYYLPAKSRRKTAAVIICPGGGYGSLYINREGHLAAKAFARRGIAAFVLKYRLPDDSTMRNKTIAPLQDALSSIKLVRDQAQRFHIDTAKIGIMGYSAGGHLAASAGVLYSKQNISVNAEQNCRPDFMILIYPVITMDTLEGHKGSTYNLLGNTPNAQLLSDFSLQLHVTENTPPAFLNVAADDKLATNTMLFCAALQKNRIPFESHIYSTGGHGFLKYPAFNDWMSLVFNWMEVNKWSTRN